MSRSPTPNESLSSSGNMTHSFARGVVFDTWVEVRCSGGMDFSVVTNAVDEFRRKCELTKNGGQKFMRSVMLFEVEHGS